MELITTDTYQSVRNHIEGEGRPRGGGNNRQGGPPPGGNGGPPPGGNGGPPPGGNGGPPPGRNGGRPPGGNGGPPPPGPGGNDGRGRRGPPVTREPRNVAVPRRPNAPVGSNRTGPGPGRGRGPDSDEGMSHSCDDRFFDCLPHAVHLFRLDLWGAVSPPPPDVVPEPGPTPAHRYPPLSRAPQTAQRPVPVAGPSTSAPQIDCFCGKPSVELTVKKESENKGRRFRRCGQPEACNFFEWADELPQEGKAKLSRPPNPPSIPAKRSRADDAVRVSYDQLYAHMDFERIPSDCKEVLSL